MSAQLLVVDDDPALCRMLERGLAAPGHTVRVCGSSEEARTQLLSTPLDVVVTDVRMRGEDGLALCAWAAEHRPDVPVIVITAFGSMETAVQALRAGAHDFVTKPFDLETIRRAVQHALERRRLRQRVRVLESALRSNGGDFEDLVGECEPMRRVYALIERLAPADSAVLVTGESGTGKELVARAIHRRSPRHAGPFVAVNCAAVPRDLLESELFGHVRGAFTDARSDRKGLFVQASGGTLFLDEIGELPLELQPKLLRALQDRRVRPVGAEREVAFDARLVCATNQDLEEAVRAGRFREDLFYRVNVIGVELPPLRARGNDVLLLARRFVERYALALNRPVEGIVPAAMERLLAYAWPGNVRELQNCIERAVTLARLSQISLEDLPDRVRGGAPRGGESEEGVELVSLEELERRHVLRVLDAVEGNKSRAARVLGLDRKTLYRKLERFTAGGEG